jgi:hypothetical protein
MIWGHIAFLVLVFIDVARNSAGDDCGFCCVSRRQEGENFLRAESGCQRAERFRIAQDLPAGDRPAFPDRFQPLDACQRAPSRPV